MSAEFCAAAGGGGAAVAMEFGVVGDVMGLQQGIAVTAPSPRDSSDLGLLKRAALTQAAAAAAAPYPSPFLDEQKMLRFSKAAHTLPSGLDASPSVISNTFSSIMPIHSSFHTHCRTKMLCPFIPPFIRTVQVEPRCMFLDGWMDMFSAKHEHDRMA